MNNDRITELYEGRIGSNFLQKRARQRIHWLCCQADGDCVLDAGCSQGIASLLLGREGHRVIGVDRERQAIEFAQARLEQEAVEVRGRVSFVVGELRELPFDADSFDTVLLGEVLEHQLDRRPMLTEIARVLDPAGVLAITAPYGHFPFPDHKEPLYLAGLLDDLAALFAVDQLALIDAYVAIVAHPRAAKQRGLGRVEWRTALEVAEQRLRAVEELLDAANTASAQAKSDAAAGRDEVARLQDDLAQATARVNVLDELVEPARVDAAAAASRLADSDQRVEELSERAAWLEERVRDEADALRDAVLDLVDARSSIDGLLDERVWHGHRQEEPQEPVEPPPRNAVGEHSEPGDAVPSEPVPGIVAAHVPAPRERVRSVAAMGVDGLVPDDAQAWLRFAKDLRGADSGRAIGAALRAAELATDPGDALWLAADLLARSDDHAAFSSVMERIGPPEQLDSKQLRRSVNVTITAGDFQRTLAIGAELARRTPAAPTAMFAIAVALWESGDEAGAEAAAAPLWSTGASDAQLSAAVRFFLRANEIAKAEATLSRIRRPTGGQILSVARRLRQEGHLERCLDAFEKALAVDPDDRDAKADHVLALGDQAIAEQRWAPPGIPQRLPLVRGRVLHLLARTAPHHLAGSAVRTHSIGKAQSRAGMDVHMVTQPGFPWTLGVGDAAACDVLDEVHYHRLRDCDAAGGKALDERLCRHLHLASELVEVLRPAVLHPHSAYANALVALELGRRFGIPVVYEVRGFPEERRWSPLNNRAQIDTGALPRRLEQSCWLQADHVVTLAEVMKRHIVASGVPSERVTVITNAIDPEEFAPAARDPTLAADVGLPDEVPVVGYITTLAPYEGIQHLIRAVALLRDRGRDVHCLLVGDGSERGALEAEADALGLRNQVTFTGVVAHDDISRYYGLIDVFVAPRTNELVSNLVTPLKPYEAMAAECAVVLARTTALSEMGIDGETARFFTPEDPESLADVLESLLGDPDGRAALAHGARAWVTEQRTWARNVELYEDVYRRLGAL